MPSPELVPRPSGKPTRQSKWSETIGLVLRTAESGQAVRLPREPGMSAINLRQVLGKALAEKGLRLRMQQHHDAFVMWAEPRCHRPDASKSARGEAG